MVIEKQYFSLHYIYYNVCLEIRCITMASDTPALLSLLFDINPYLWNKRANEFQFCKIIEQFCMFVNAFLLLHRLNQVSIFAFDAAETLAVHSTLIDKHSGLKNVPEKILELIKTAKGSEKSAIASAVSIALCRIFTSLFFLNVDANKYQKQLNAKIEQRILIVNV